MGKKRSTPGFNRKNWRTRHDRSFSPRSKKAKQEREKVPGLGAPLGDPLVVHAVPDWLDREARWAFNLKNILKKEPRLFDSKFFNSLKRIGGRSEGDVRLFRFGRNVQRGNRRVWVPDTLVTSSGRGWDEVAVKRFKKHARSGAENQARTLHVLNNVIAHLKKTGALSKFPFDVRAAEAIAFRGPFLVMRSFLRNNVRRADELPEPVYRQVEAAVRELDKQVYHARKKLIRKMEKAGMEYPSPDLIMSNVFFQDMSHTRKKDSKKPQPDILWLIDQFTEPVHAKDARFRRQSSKRLSKKWRK